MRDDNDISTIAAVIPPTNGVGLTICPDNRPYAARAKRVCRAFTISPNDIEAIAWVATLVSASPIVDIRATDNGLGS